MTLWGLSYWWCQVALGFPCTSKCSPVLQQNSPLVPFLPCWSPKHIACVCYYIQYAWTMWGLVINKSCVHSWQHWAQKSPELKIVTDRMFRGVLFRVIWFLQFFSCPLILLLEVDKWIAGAVIWVGITPTSTSYGSRRPCTSIWTVLTLPFFLIAAKGSGGAWMNSSLGSGREWTL